MNEFARFDFALDCVPPADAVRRAQRAQFRACGVVSNVVKKLSKKDNRPWFYFTLSGRDNSKNWQINAFSDMYEDIMERLKSRANSGDGESVDISALEGKCFCVVGECRSEDGAQLRMNAQSITPMEEAIAANVTAIEWLISPYNRPEHFVKQLSQCVYNEAAGGSIRHRIKIQVSDGGFLEFSRDDLNKSSYKSGVFAKLFREPAFIDAKILALPPQERESKFRKFDYRKDGGRQNGSPSRASAGRT